MDIKIVQIEIKIEPINLVHDHFLIFQQISIGHVAAALGPLAAALGHLACPSRSEIYN